jgi:hypothetical protein
MARTRQATEPTPARELTPAQWAALGALAAGQGDGQAAEAAGVDLAQVGAWRDSDPLFAAALNRQRAGQWEEQSDRLRALIPRAIDALGQCLDSGDPKTALAAARAILTGAGLLGGDLRPAGAIVADKVDFEWHKERHVSAIDRMGWDL